MRQRRFPQHRDGERLATLGAHAGLPEAIRRFTLLTVLLLLALFGGAARAGAWEIRLTTGNDLLVTDQDDLYTFAVSLQMNQGPYDLSFHENAFTDRQAGIRFDESHLTVGRQVSVDGPWSLYAAGGIVRVGEGLFGEEAQNAVHDLLGGDEVELSYVHSSVHGRAMLIAERSFGLRPGLSVGPRVEVDAIPGLRSHAILGGHLSWDSASGWLSVEARVGARFSEASHDALEPHLVPVAPAARIGAVVRGKVVLTWSYNEYGDEREHLGLGFRVSSPDLRGRRGERGR